MGNVEALEALAPHLSYTPMLGKYGGKLNHEQLIEYITHSMRVENVGSFTVYCLI